MTTPEALNALADRVEREEPSWRLTCEIEAAVAGATLRDDCVRQGIPIFLEDNTRPLGRRQWRPPPYTTSLDAAVTLVPEGFVWGAANLYGPSAHVVGAEDAEGKVPTGDSDAEGTRSVALALCAAALRARAADMQARAALSPTDGAPEAPPKVRSPE